MNISIEINKQTPFRKFKNFDLYLKKITHKALALHKFKKTNYTISVLICNDDEIQKLNHQFRGKNKPTNVLSFPDGEKFGNQILLGSIAISIETLKKEAQEQGKTFKTHFLHLFIHSVLHVLGMDHEKEQEQNEMEAMEDLIMNYIAHEKIQKP